MLVLCVIPFPTVPSACLYSSPFAIGEAPKTASLSTFRRNCLLRSFYRTLHTQDILRFTPKLYRAFFSYCSVCWSNPQIRRPVHSRSAALQSGSVSRTSGLFSSIFKRRATYERRTRLSRDSRTVIYLKRRSERAHPHVCSPFRSRTSSNTPRTMKMPKQKNFDAI